MAQPPRNGIRFARTLIGKKVNKHNLNEPNLNLNQAKPNLNSSS